MTFASDGVGPGRLLIRGGRIIDPASGLDATGDVLVEGGVVAAIGRISLAQASEGGVSVETIDAEGCIVAPGLIDPHVHLREPGHEYKETIATGSAGAVRGGFTSVCCMPNTSPPLDSPAALALVETMARRAGLARIFSVAAATIGRKGDRVGPLWTLAEAGAVGFSDDGDCIMDAAVMRCVLASSHEAGRCFMQHCQDVSLTRGASMNAGPLSTRLGLGGWPRVAEEIIVERDVRLNRDIGCAYHVQHLSSAGSVDIVRGARRAGQPITAEASPHHLLLTDEACAAYDTNAKMNPPLRGQADINAIKEGIANGTITVLATDHAPHSPDEKARDFASAPHGVIGLECALPLYVKALVSDGVIDWPRLVALLTTEPARLVGLDRRGLGTLTPGGVADLTIIDPDIEWTVDVRQFASLSRNCPFDGWLLKGRAIATVVGGKVRYRSERVRACARTN